MKTWYVTIGGGTLANVNASSTVVQAVMVSIAASIFKSKSGGKKFFGLGWGTTGEEVELRWILRELILQLGRHFRAKIDQIKRHVVLLRQTVEDSGSEFITGKLW